MKKREHGESNFAGDGAKLRFPKRVYAVGEDPDPRFSLANERTFLAWIRTSLALVATGVALEAFGFPASDTFRSPGALIFIFLGILSAIRAWTGWSQTERALRQSALLPSPALGILIVAGIAVGSILILIGAFI